MSQFYTLLIRYPVKRLLQIFLVTAFIVLNVNKASAQFHQVHYDSYNNYSRLINRLDFYQPNEGYVAYSNSIGFTSDTGHTFTVMDITNSNVNYGSNDVNITFGFSAQGVKAFNRNKLIVYGDYGLVPAILYSSDGGNTFKLVFSSQPNAVPANSVTDMVFPSGGQTGYAVDKDRVLKTTDGGLTWSVNKILTGSGIAHIQATSDNQLIVYGINSSSASAMYGTTNGGSSWQQVQLPAGYIQSAFCISATKWYLNLAAPNAYSADTYVTTNSGVTFVKQNIDIAEQTCGKMIFINDSTGYAIGNSSDNHVYKTTNSGKLWEKLGEKVTNTTTSLNDIQLLGNQIWAGGVDGFLITSSNAGGPAIPSVYFSIDASAVATSGKVSLINYSHTGYQYKWLRNGKVIAISYNATYQTDLYQPNDNIKLIITNGSAVDSAEQTTSFSKGLTIYSFDPQSGHKGTFVNISGSNFGNVTGVTFGGVPAASFVVNSDFNITAVVAKGASGDIVVTNTKTHGSKSGFKFVPPPHITAFTPVAALETDTVTITGTTFLNTSSVMFGNEPASYFKVVSATQIKAVAGNGQSGNIIITTDAGADTIAGFHVIPHLISFTSTTGNFGTSISLTGTGLSDVTAVTLDGYPVQSFQTSNTGIALILGEGSAGVFKVTSPGGSSTISGFKYYRPPVIKSFTPLSAQPGSSLTISGSGFDPALNGNLVYIGGSRASVTAATASSLTITVPAGVTYSLINVIAHGQYGYSSQYFVPVFKGGGDITQSSFGAPTTLHAGNNSHRIFFADFDGNGLPEVIETEYTSGGDAGIVFYNRSKPGNINLTERFVYDDEHGDNDGATSGGVIDYDQDGKIDLMLAGVFQGKPAAIMNEQIDVTNLTDPFYLHTIFNTITLGYNDAYFGGYNTNVPQDVSMADMDGDGKIDFVTGNIYGSPFANEMLADIDGDGRPDVLVKNGNLLSVYRNISTKGTIAYDKKVDFDAGGTIANITTGDFDNDGKLDVAVVTQGTSNGAMLLFHNTSTAGVISLVKTTNVGITDLPYTVCTGDLNGDGLLDLCVGAGGNLYVYQNKSKSGGFSLSAPVIFKYDASQAIGIADIDGDNQPEVLVLPRGGFDGNIIRNLIGKAQITSFTPTGGTNGAQIQIKGSGFNGATAVQIGGKGVKSFKINSSTSITAVVGADTTGYISVNTSTGVGSSLTQFTFLQKPTIVYYSPLVFQKGDSIILSALPGDAALKFQWYKDGSSLPATNKQSITAKTSGSYTVAEIFGADTVMSDAVVVRVIYDLPVNNFTIATASVTCKGSNNGSIKITAAAKMNYIATLTNSAGTANYPFTTTKTIDNLAAGDYHLCFTIDGEPDFSQCFDLNITEPKDLSLYATVDKQTNSIQLQFDGGDTYNVALNGKTYSTTQTALTLPLAAGTNKIEVSTDKPCQGTILKLVNTASAITPYPNPFIDILNLNLGDRPVSKAVISISSASGGKVLYYKQLADQYGVVQLDLSGLGIGVYFLVLELDNERTVYKITK